MAMLLRTVWIVMLCVLGAACAGTAQNVVVTGDRVCLRAKADGESEVVCQVSSGTVLQRTGEDSNWVEVLAPVDASVWLAANLVSNGVVQGSKAHLRAGPGLNYPSVGSVQKNDKVESRGEAYGWVKIRPPESCRLWVSRSYVKPAPEQRPVADQSVSQAKTLPPASVAAVPPARSSSVEVVGATNTSTAGTPQKVLQGPVPPSVPAVPTAVTSLASQAVVKASTVTSERVEAKRPPVLPDSLRKYEMEEGASQAREALYRGTMDRCNWLLRKPAEYRLVTRHPRRGIVTLCYVSGDSTLLAAVDGKRVAVSGHEYRLKGVDRPVVVYESVVEDEANVTRDGSSPVTP